MILKSWKLLLDQQKFSSNLLSNSNGGFLTLKGGGGQQWGGGNSTRGGGGGTIVVGCQQYLILLSNYQLAVFIISNLLSNPKGGFLTLESQNTWIKTIKVKKLKKEWQKLSKNGKVLDVKILQDIPLHLEIIQ